MKTAKEVVNSIFEAWNLKDLDTIASLIDINVALDSPLSRTRGKAAFLKRTKTIWEHQFELTMQEQFSDGEVVVSIVDAVVPTPEGRVKIPAIEYAKVSDGKLVSNRIFYDASNLREFLVMNNEGIPVQKEHFLALSQQFESLYALPELSISHTGIVMLLFDRIVAKVCLGVS